MLKGAILIHFLFFSAQYLPTIGGVERYTASLGKTLHQKGHSVSVVTSALDGLATIETDAQGTTIYRIPVIWLLNNRFPVIYPSKSLRHITRELKKKTFDFAVVQTHFYPLSLYGTWLMHHMHVRCAVVDHGTSYLMQGGIKGLLGKGYEHAISFALKRYTTLFLGVSKNCCKWLSTFGIQTNRVLYNAVNPDELSSIAKKAPPEMQNDLFKICFVGRFIKEKGALPLALAFERLQRTRAVQLIMVGHGECLEEIQQLKIPNLILTGGLAYPDTLGILQHSDLFCLPTTFGEGFPTAVLEASALKTPTLTTDAGGSKELIVDEMHGYILSDTSIDEIYNKLAFLYDQRNTLPQVGKNAYCRLVENFTWDKVSEQLIALAQSESIS